MFKYFLIIVVIVLIIYFFRTKIFKNFINKEIESIRDLNYSDDEIEFLVKKYSDSTSEELLLKQKTNLTEKEYRAIQKVLNDRQMIQPTDISTFF